MSAATLTKRLPGIEAKRRIGWTDPGAAERRGLVVSIDDGGILTKWDDGPQKKIPWGATNLHLLCESCGTGRVTDDAPFHGYCDACKGDRPTTLAEGLGLSDAARHHIDSATARAEEPVNGTSVRTGVELIGLEYIQPCPLNPRKAERSGEYLQELADDIREHGQINPITLRETSAAEQQYGAKLYEIISGECRYRAHRLAGLPRILAINRGPLTPEQAYEETIRENAQRQQLNPLEEAIAVRQMLAFGWGQDRVGKLLGGKSQSWISRTADLLGLPGPVQELIHLGRLSRTHAEELLALGRWQKDLAQVAAEAVEQSWSTRQLAERVREVRARNERREQLDLDVPPPQPKTAPPAAEGVVPVPLADAPTADELDARTDPGSAGPEPTADSPAAPSSAEPPKSGALMSAEDKLKQRLASREALPPPPPAPAPALGTTSFPLLPEMVERLTAAGTQAMPALRVGAEVAEIAQRHQIKSRDLVAWVGRLLDFHQQLGGNAAELVGVSAEDAPAFLLRSKLERIGSQSASPAEDLDHAEPEAAGAA